MNREKINELENKIKNDYSNITGIVVLKHGEVQYENYFNECTSSSRIHVYSVTKSIISILIGIAIDKGHIKSINQNIIDFFPNYKLKKRDKTIRNVTIKDLLTMTTPYKLTFLPLAYIRYFMSSDRVRFALNSLGGKGQLGEFTYAPLIGPDILSGILTQATEQSVLDFARDNLFSPLGITIESSINLHNANEQSAFNKATNISGWVVDSTGINSAGWGLTLSPTDMAKIGQLYLSNGIWDGKQIVSREWIHESTKEHSKWDKENLSYGYLWWVIDSTERSYAAMGDGGNVIYVNTAKNTVVAITSLFKQNVTDRIQFIKEYIEPILD